MTQVVEIPDGTRGFDCNQTLTLSQAQAFKAHGYEYVSRYLRRAQAHPYDLSANEAITILGAGLGLFAVQHVESESSWVPSAEKGGIYGRTAAGEAAGVGLPAGVTVACDLEGVAPGTDAQAVIDYLEAWFAPVRDAGFLDCLYVGWNHVLTPAQLYDLSVTRYWGALNLNLDEFPATRGLAMKQHEEKPDDRPDGIAFPFDTDTANADALGGRITVVAPGEWAV